MKVAWKNPIFDSSFYGRCSLKTVLYKPRISGPSAPQMNLDHTRKGVFTWALWACLFFLHCDTCSKSIAAKSFAFFIEHILHCAAFARTRFYENVHARLGQYHKLKLIHAFIPLPSPQMYVNLENWHMRIYFVIVCVRPQSYCFDYTWK